MYIPEELQKVNKFVDVAIPSPRSYFQRLGEVKPSGESFSGDDVVPEPMRKTDSINDYIDYAEQMARLEELEQKNANK